MDLNLQQEVSAHIFKYKGYKKEGYKIKKRNEIYLILKPFLIKWIKSILKNWSTFEREEVILSLSWDAFEFSLKYYNNLSVPVPKHFHDYCRYYLLTFYARKDRVFLPMEELKETLLLIPTYQNISFERLLTLCQYRDSIPKDDVVVWDDAILSLSDGVKRRHCSKSPGMRSRTYFRLKKAYISIIKLVLGKK